MTETSKPQSLAEEVKAGEVEYNTLYRIPASEDWPWGAEVGFVEVEGWILAMNWGEAGSPLMGHFAIEPDIQGCLPVATEWMITDNNAIDYGLEKST